MRKKKTSNVRILTKNFTKNFSKLTSSIFKKNNLKCKRIKTANREYRSPYDFLNTMAFSRLYTDIKHIPDKHALPLEIYNKFKYSCDND